MLYRFDISLLRHRNGTGNTLRDLYGGYTYSRDSNSVNSYALISSSTCRSGDGKGEVKILRRPCGVPITVRFYRGIGVWLGWVGK